MPSDSEPELLTLTHARLRVRSGDYVGARRLLRCILELDPEHVEARELLRSIVGLVPEAPPDAAEEPLAPPEAGDPRGLAAEFRRILAGPVGSPVERIQRLERWLARVRRAG
jgi:hypothetical protein